MSGWLGPSRRIAACVILCVFGCGSDPENGALAAGGEGDGSTGGVDDDVPGGDPYGTGGVGGATDTDAGPIDPVCDGPVGAGACQQVSLCDAFGCGGKAQGLDHYGCERTTCTSHAECPETERCHPVAMEETCLPSAETCEDVDGDCVCTAAQDCTGTYAAHCLPIEVYPLEEDCDPAQWECEELAERQQSIADAFAHHLSSGHDDLAVDLGRCSERVAMARIADTCGESACRVVCELGSCGAFEDVDSCVAACEALVADGTAIEAVVPALAAAPPTDGSCACAACDGEDTTLCADLWGC